ncbi:MAG: DUF4402 domain-containing protein [Bacteroidales bacterium]|nr:DUF4402 domain-containing protein [Bacteroidales bacterium]
MKKILFVSVMLFAFAMGAYSQSATTTASASAVIIAPLTITVQTNLHFGTVMRSAAAGTVTVSPTDGSRSALGGVTLSALAPLHSRAVFRVDGETGRTYSISLPATDVLISNGTDQMEVNTFTSDPTPTGSIVAGTSTLYVGATLNVDANQASGAYTGTFDVTVNYN